MHQAIITLSLSEAQWDLYPHQAGDNWEHKIVVDLPDGPWILFRYEDMTNQSGDEKGLPYFSRTTGMWHIDNGEPGDKTKLAWTDITIEIIEADHVPTS